MQEAGKLNPGVKEPELGSLWVACCTIAASVHELGGQILGNSSTAASMEPDFVSRSFVKMGAMFESCLGNAG